MTEEAAERPVESAGEAGAGDRSRDPADVLDDRHRPGLMAHCYRMLGSVHEAEDLVQETYLRAWRAYRTFEGRSSVRSWLYRIATNACLDALQSRRMRPMPTGLGQDASDPAQDLVQTDDVPWLQPVPDALLAEGADDPARIVAGRDSVRLAFVTALQHLPPRQRAVVVLRDVLAWRAAEVAEAVGVSTPAVHSLHQRARATLADVRSRESAPAVEPLTAEQRDLLSRYVAAFERYDVVGLVDMFTADAVWEMPPFTGWYQGGPAIARLIGTRCPAAGPEDIRMVATAANGQPAFALYLRGADGVHRAFQIQVLTLDGDRVAHVGCFFDLSLIPTFGLPDVWTSEVTTQGDRRRPPLSLPRPSGHP
jgi:RNA polymerase sigma-70 factor (ECF subfamily)